MVIQKHGHIGYVGSGILLLHMGDFWWKMKFGSTDLVMAGDIEVKDLYSKVYASFKVTWIVVAYLIACWR